MYNVLIVEDDPMARKLLEIFVATSDNYHLVPSLDSAAMVELYCMTNHVDLVLMDVCTSMDANGIEAAVKLKKNYPQIKIIIMTSQPEYSYIDQARKIGVESFWYKEPTAEALLKMMDRTMALALADKVADGTLTMAQAKRWAKAMLWDNPVRFYGIKE